MDPGPMAMITKFEAVTMYNVHHRVTEARVCVTFAFFLS